jgi:hypothetical protein
MDHVARPLQILLVEKEGMIWFNIICLKLYQFEKITWWCLFVMGFVMEYAVQLVMSEKNIKKVMVFRNFRLVGFHVDFSSMKSSLSL